MNANMAGDHEEIKGIINNEPIFSPQIMADTARYMREIQHKSHMCEKLRKLFTVGSSNFGKVFQFALQTKISPVSKNVRMERNIGFELDV
jgi:hypothetical protein